MKWMGDGDKTFRLKYIGTCFEGARLPGDVLSDLPAFRDANARQRVPSGFDEGLSFDLIGVEDGSAVSVLSWNRNLAQANLPGIADEVESIVDASYGEVVRLLDGAGRNVFPKSLPAEFDEEKLPCAADPIETTDTQQANTAHALADCAAFSAGQRKLIARRPKLVARARGVVFRP